MATRIIASISSDLGTALARTWLAAGHTVAGTYRTPSSALDELRVAGAQLVKCDVRSGADVDTACGALIQKAGPWDVLVIAPATLEPIGPFESADFDRWEESFRVNFAGPMRFLHRMLAGRRRGTPEGPMVLLFAGGGNNGPAPSLSAYTVAKIAQVKMCELLDAEIPDVRFAIVGPGTVDTKINEEVYRAKERAPDAYDSLVGRLADHRDVPTARVVDCCDWLIGLPRVAVSGRNFSCQYDEWGSARLVERLLADSDMYKIRRRGN